MSVSAGTYQSVYVGGWFGQDGIQAADSSQEAVSVYTDGWFYDYDYTIQSNSINDIIFVDGMVIVSANKDVREGFFGHKLNKKVQSNSDLIKLWNGLTTL